MAPVQVPAKAAFSPRVLLPSAAAAVKLPHLLICLLLLAPARGVDLTAPVERLAGGFQNSEGPVWNAARGELLFSDVNGNTIHRWKDGQLTTFRAPSGNANGLALDRAGRLVSCERATRRLARTEADGSITVLAERHEGRRFNSPNDLVLRRDGSIYFTDPTFGVDPASLEMGYQGVYRIAPDGRSVSLVARNLSQPNGLAFSPDERHLYVNDNQSGLIWIYEVAPDGSLAQGRVFTDQAPGGDGMKVDVEGTVFCTTSAGLRAFDRAGRLLGTIVTPERPANCAFGDADGRTLYLTCRGGLYRIRLEVPGRTGQHPADRAEPALPGPARLSNLSVRSRTGAGGDTLIMGFVVGAGAGPSVLVRGVGPSLAGFGLDGLIADPLLTLFGQGSAVLAGSDNWSNASDAPLIAQAAARVGAFPLAETSRDAALLAVLGGAPYTAQVAAKGTGGGIALVEAYEVPSGSATAPLVNLSARALVGTGADVLIAGFALGGSGPSRLLIRAVGPTLAAFGVNGALGDPALSLHRGETLLAANDNWSQAANAADLAAATSAAGAFSLAFGSRDAALLTQLEPGTYSVVVTGVGNTIGTALVEIYLVR